MFTFVIFTRKLAQFQSMLIEYVNNRNCRNSFLQSLFLDFHCYNTNCVSLHTTVTIIKLRNAASSIRYKNNANLLYSFNSCQSPFEKDTCRALFGP